MQKAWSNATANTPTKFRVHVDGGANRSITNDYTILLQYKNIKKYPMSGVAADEPAIVCTGVGLLPWLADNGEVVLVNTYYSPNAVELLYHQRTLLRQTSVTSLHGDNTLISTREKATLNSTEEIKSLLYHSVSLHPMDCGSTIMTMQQQIIFR
jgi:hypothetical protein